MSLNACVLLLSRSPLRAKSCGRPYAIQSVLDVFAGRPSFYN